MISYAILSSVGDAAEYYRADIQVQQAGAGEYYVGELAPSRWLGNAAETAGVSTGQPVTREDFLAALEGRLRNPVTGEFQQIGGDKHRPGFDFTFSAPKSFSVAAMVGGDYRLLAAHEAAVARALKHLEAQASCRVRLDDKTIENRRTGNLLAAAFSHDTSRALDPQIHTHVVTANATWDQQSGKWRSLDPSPIIRELKTADAIYKNEYAKLAIELGYEVAWTKDGPELRAVSREQCLAFSKRDAQIKAALAERGTRYEDASAQERKLATLSTRDRKELSLDRDKLLARWDREARAVGLDAKAVVGQALERALAGASLNVDPRAAVEAVHKATAHLAEREAAFSRDALTRSANQFACGAAGNDQIQAAINNALAGGQLLRAASDRITTPAAVALELEMRNRIHDGKLACTSVIDGRALDAAMARLDATRGFVLNDGQRDAARLLLTGRDRFTAIQGYAGTGKTSMLDTVRQIAEARDWVIVGMSAGAKQAAILQRDSGIKSQTVASFLGELRRQSPVTDAKALESKVPESKVLWVVDEASQLSQRDTSELIRRAESAGTRVVFVGDAKQHQSVEAGIAFEKMQQAGIATAKLTEVNRQKDDTGKEIVRDILGNDIASAYERLDKVVTPDNAQLIRQLANDYASSPVRENTLIVTARNADKDAINGAVRAELKTTGVLGGTDVPLRTLEKIDMTAAEAREAWRYEPGMIVQADRTYKRDGIAQGESFRVAAVDDRRNVVALVRDDGSRITWNPSQRTAFNAYHENTIQVSAGDRLRFTKNGAEAKNGEVGIIKIVQEQLFVQIGEREIPLDAGRHNYVQIGYASTSYGAQGDTQDRCLYHINTASAGGLGDRDFYVGVTRARDGSTLYTTDADRAADLVQIAMGKTSATGDLSIKAESPVGVGLATPIGLVRELAMRL